VPAVVHFGLVFSLRFINHTRAQAAWRRPGQGKHRPVRQSAIEHAGARALGQADKDTADRKEREKAMTAGGQERIHPQKLLSQCSGLGHWAKRQGRLAEKRLTTKWRGR